MTSLLERKSINLNGHINGKELHSNDIFDRVMPLNGKPPANAEGFTYGKTSDSLRANVEDGELNTPILPHPPNLYKQTGVFVSKRYLKLNPCEETIWLLANHPFAYLLLSLVAIRAERNIDNPSGLQIGESFIGDYEAIGATRQQYRTALNVLVRRKYLTISETCRTRKKSTTGTTTKGTKVKLLNSIIWDINIEEVNHRLNQCPTTDQPPTNHDQDRLDDKIDLIDLENLDFDPKTMIRFKHKKTGSIQVKVEELYSKFQSEGWTPNEISQAIQQMRASDPQISGTIQKYLSTILTNNRTQQEKEKKWKKPQKNQPSPTETPSNAKSPKDKGYYSEGDMSEAPLAKLARQSGLK